MTFPTTVARTSQRSAHRQNPIHGVRADDGQHAFLALARHDLPRRHARLPSGDGGHVDVHANPAPRRRFAGGAGQAGAAEILDADHQPLVEQLQTGLNEPLLFEGIADLDVGSFGLLGFGIITESGRCQDAHTANPVTASKVPEQHRQVSFARSAP